MGDGAGVGPEIIVKALMDPELYLAARPVVIGDLRRLEIAAEICGLAPSFNLVRDPLDGRYVLGTIDVINPRPLPVDLPFGELSAEAGDAAYEYIVEAVRLALDGSVDAICTGPLNKKALHMAGHNYPGHTELLAALTGVDEVSMMLMAPTLRVIHVTTHVGLKAAIDLINPGLVSRTIARADLTMRKAGIDAPRIAVCAVNPHGGEGGLFGEMEEELKIAPGVEEAIAAGIDARGPLPADTAFFRAVRGDFDIVVAMYHDQGHCPIKVLGIDAGVNITVGLPVIRTSVDHGTAFDIAGTGTADDAGMREALRQAIVLAPGADRME
jgi:4-phospho-D-threonate 3-dehydrogenase / 4-phospho-D-erythronate 3-dehydrogenase